VSHVQQAAAVPATVETAVASRQTASLCHITQSQSEHSGCVVSILQSIHTGWDNKNCMVMQTLLCTHSKDSVGSVDSKENISVGS